MSATTPTPSDGRPQLVRDWRRDLGISAPHTVKDLQAMPVGDASVKWRKNLSPIARRADHRDLAETWSSAKVGASTTWSRSVPGTCLAAQPARWIL